ncbi:formyl peptide receptor-related sequence 6-like [Pelodiscus sinensis]|uniref:formyl peptide receptor-related sequence 6-like n=1 Tax=Pelodiscus sinensis TaxID=13735 RepID=UPI003F6B609F
MGLCSLAFLMGVTGNGFIIFTTGCRKKKTVDGMCHLNLATSGFIFTAFLPLTVAQLAMGLHWYLRSFLCKIINIITTLSMFSRCFHLTAISTDHCLTTLCPVWAQNHRTVHLASLVMLGTWILSVIVTWRYHGLCSDQSLLLRETGDAVNVAARFLIGFLLPLALNTICLIILAAKRGQNQVAQAEKPLRTLLVLNACFFLCWFPYHVIAFLDISPRASPPDATASLDTGAIFAHSLLCFHSCFYPLFYLSTRQHFAGCWGRRRSCQTPANAGAEPAESAADI